MCKYSLKLEQNRHEDKYDSIARVYSVCHGMIFYTLIIENFGQKILIIRTKSIN